MIEAELIGKEGDTLEAMINGRRYQIPISSLSEKDREFLTGWEPGS